MVYLWAVRVHMPSLHSPPKKNKDKYPPRTYSTFTFLDSLPKADGGTGHTVILSIGTDKRICLGRAGPKAHFPLLIKYFMMSKYQLVYAVIHCFKFRR